MPSERYGHTRRASRGEMAVKTASRKGGLPGPRWRNGNRERNRERNGERKRERNGLTRSEAVRTGSSPCNTAVRSGPASAPLLQACPAAIVVVSGRGGEGELDVTAGGGCSPEGQRVTRRGTKTECSARTRGGEEKTENIYKLERKTKEAK